MDRAELKRRGYNKFNFSLYKNTSGYQESWEKWIYKEARKAYAIHVHRWEFEIRPGEWHKSYEAKVQFDNKDAVFDVSLTVTGWTTHEVEEFFDKVFERMECRYYGN